MSRWFRLGGLAACLALAYGGAARGDTFKLKEGGRIEGEIVEETESAYRIRTTTGVFDIEKDRVVERKASTPPWEAYEREKAKCQDTAEGHYRLSKWCRERGLRTEQREHLLRVIELQPDHAAARAGLGYEKQDGKWVQRKRLAPKKVSEEELEARRRAKQDEKVVRKAITEWHVKIQAIYRGRLEGESATSSKFRDGRRQILEIDDPLAIPPLTRILSQGSAACRRLLVEALTRFPQDEATMNLIVMAVLDPSAGIRRMAAIELIDRNDERVIDELRGALTSEEEFVLRNAAAALGILKARAAVDDLISVLSTVAVQNVRVCLPVFFDSVYDTFGCGARYRWGGRSVYYRPSYIGVIGPAYPVGTLYYSELQLVSIHRTEVQEALISITGQNFGFDESAWRLWLRQNGG